MIFGSQFQGSVEVHLLNSSLQVDVQHRHRDSLSPAAVSSMSLGCWNLYSVFLIADETLFTKFLGDGGDLYCTLKQKSVFF